MFCFVNDKTCTQQKNEQPVQGWRIQHWTMSKSRYYKERNVQSKKRKAIRRWFVSIRHGRHVLSQCPKQRPPPVLVPFLNISGGWMPLFRALAKNMAPMTNADESPTNRLTLFPIYLSLFIVSTLWQCCAASLFNVVNNIVQHWWAWISPQSGETMLNNIVDNIIQLLDETEQNIVSLSVASRSIICRCRRQRQIIDLQSRYFAIAEFNNCFIIYRLI